VVRPLPQPLQIIDENEKLVLTLTTLGDVPKVLLGLPETFQSKTTWGHVATMLDEAAHGGDIIDVIVPLRMVLGVEGRVPAEIARSASSRLRQADAASMQRWLGYRCRLISAARVLRVLGALRWRPMGSMVLR
jgi:hypothetical protein